MALSKKTKLILAPVLIFALLLTGSELYYRYKYKEELKDQFSPLIYAPDSVTGYRYAPNSSGFISKPGIREKSVSINKHGFNSPDFEDHKKPGVFRIVIVGTSVASGIWMDGKIDYCRRLQQKFLQNGYKNVEIINCSLDGEGLGLALLELEKRNIVNYEPDLVLHELNIPVSLHNMHREPYGRYILQYYNDSSRKAGMQAIDEIESNWPFTFCYDNFYTFRAWCRKYIQTNKGRKAELFKTYKDRISRIEEGDPSYYRFNKSISLLKEVNDTIINKTHGRMVYFAYGNDKQKLSAYLQEQGIRSVYLNCKFERKHESSPDTHLNESGHDLIADSLYNTIIANKFFQ